MQNQSDIGNEPRVLSQSTEFATPWFEVVSKQVANYEGAEVQPYYVIHPPDYVTILAKTTDGKVPLVRQFRPALEAYALELPSGHVDKGEDPSETAVRELLEETGYGGGEVNLLGELAPDTGRLGNRLWGFYAAGVEVDPQWRGKTEPGIEVVMRPANQVSEMVASGELMHSHDLAVIAVAITKHLLCV